MYEPLQIQAGLRIFRRGEKAFGPGIARLLEGVEELGSLRSSARRMGMSYNKAWSVLHSCEAHLGYPLLHRHSGGAGGGGASLTEEGRRLLSRYRAFEAEAETMLDQLARQYFDDTV